MNSLLEKIIIFFLSSIFLANTAIAYNFVYTKETGEPIKWDNSQPIRYYLDPEPLDTRYTLEQTLTLLQEAMKLWEEVPSAKVPRFEFAGYLPEDVNKDNYENYLDENDCFTESWEYCDNPELHEDFKTVIIIDSGNWLLDNVLTLTGGATAIAGTNTFEGGFAEDAKRILQGYVVYGMSPGDDTAGTVAWFAHEIGHLLGLHHTFLNQQIFSSAAYDLGIEWNLYFPTMQVGNASTTDKSYGATLNPDDVAGISILYPLDTFNQETAKIKGVVKKSDGSPMPEANVIARDVNDPLCKSYSFITGRFCTHEGVILHWSCDQADGSYTIEGLPPGNYTVEVEEITDGANRYFFASEPELAGDAEYWNEGDQADEDPYAYTIISLAAGETRENIDIILNRSEVTEDRVKFIPLDVLLANFPLPETTACTDTTIDYAGLIGYEEPGTATTPAAGCSLIVRR